MLNRAYIEMKLDGKPIHINGIVTEYETSIEDFGVRETTVTIKEIEEAPNNLMHHLMHPQPRCNPIFKEEEEEDESMSVRIKKQPKEITIEELQKGEEYEEVIIHIDKDKKEEIENKYGITYDYTSKLFLLDDELKFKENYLITK